MHTVTGATSIAGLKKWAAQQPAPGADGAASAQYVAVASDACNIEFDFLGRPQAHTCRAGVAVPAAVAPGTCGSRRPRAGLRQSLGSEAERAMAVLGGVWVGGRVRSPAAVVLCSLAGARPSALTSLRLCG